MIKDKILISRDYLNLHSTCLSCMKIDHRINECPFISCFSSFKRQMIIQKHIYTKPQNRRDLMRKPQRLLLEANQISVNENIMEIYSKSLENTTIFKNNENFIYNTEKSSPKEIEKSKSYNLNHKIQFSKKLIKCSSNEELKNPKEKLLSKVSSKVSEYLSSINYRLKIENDNDFTFLYMDIMKEYKYYNEGGNATQLFKRIKETNFNNFSIFNIKNIKL